MSAWLINADVKAIQETSSEEHEALIDILIPVVQARFISESNYDPETADRVEEIYVKAVREIALHYYPITAVTKIEEVSGSFVSTLSSEYYAVRPDGIIEFDFPITGRLKITYVAGYEVASIPPDILDVCKKQIIEWLNKIPNRLGKKSIGKGGETTTFNTQVGMTPMPLLDEFMRVCETYRNPIPDRSVVT